MLSGCCLMESVSSLLCTCLSGITRQDKIDTKKSIRSTIDKFLSMGITLNTFAVKNGFAHNP